MHANYHVGLVEKIYLYLIFGGKFLRFVKKSKYIIDIIMNLTYLRYVSGIRLLSF